MMKTLQDYLSESEHAAENPVAGDTFAINIREECLIESVVIESRDDGVVIAADDRMIKLLESYGYTFEENCMECGMMECGCGGSDEDSYGDDEPAADPGEYDDEGDMAKDELMTMIRSARKLIGMLDNADNMPEWTQKKITKATDYVDTAADYVASKKERGVMEQDVEEGLGKTIKRSIAGWGAFDKDKPKDVVNKVKGQDTDVLKRLHEPNTKKGKGSPAELQQKAISRELKKREQGVTEGSGETSPVARAVLHRIMMAHPGVLATHGPEKVMNAVDELADRVGDVDEIGTSDVSGWVRDVIRMLSELSDESMSDVDRLEEGPNDGTEDNFTVDDIKRLEQIRDLETLKAQAKQLIKGKPARRMKPEKISWFYNQIDTLRSPLAVIKMMYDLMLAGEGHRVIGSRNSMSSNSYRSKFGEQDVAEGVEQLHPETLELIDEYISKIEPDADRDEMIQSVINGTIHTSELEYALQDDVTEAEYQGRKVPLGKPMKGDVAKSKVYVRDPKTGNVKKVNFGDPNMKIKKSNPARRKSFRARHNCDNPGPRTSARYWSCRAW